MPEISIKDLARVINRVTEIDSVAKPLLLKLLHHHRSQAKPATVPVSKRYNGELAEEIKEFLDLLDK